MFPDVQVVIPTNPSIKLDLLKFVTLPSRSRRSQQGEDPFVGLKMDFYE